MLKKGLQKDMTLYRAHSWRDRSLIFQEELAGTLVILGEWVIRPGELLPSHGRFTGRARSLRQGRRKNHVLSKKWMWRFSEVLELHVKPGVNILYTWGGGVWSGLPERHTCITSFMDRAQLWAWDTP